MDQKTLVVKDSIYRIRCSAADLAHPQPVRSRSNASNLYSSCFQIDEEQDEKTAQSSPCPDFDGEEVRRNDQVPMTLEELHPGRFSISLGCRFDTVPSEDSSDRTPSALMPQVGQRTLQPTVAPIPIFLCHTDHQGCYIVLFQRPTGFAVCAPVVLLGNELSVPSQQRCWRYQSDNLAQKFAT